MIIEIKSCIIKGGYDFVPLFTDPGVKIIYWNARKDFRELNQLKEVATDFEEDPDNDADPESSYLL